MISHSRDFYRSFLSLIFSKFFIPFYFKDWYHYLNTFCILRLFDFLVQKISLNQIFLFHFCIIYNNKSSNVKYKRSSSSQSLVPHLHRIIIPPPSSFPFSSLDNISKAPPTWLRPFRGIDITILEDGKEPFWKRFLRGSFNRPNQHSSFFHVILSRSEGCNSG